MGQATVDLPDPTEAPTADTAASADDLLAQLAGDEIDRLLAEADAAPLAPPPPRTDPPADPPVDPPPQATAPIADPAPITPPADPIPADELATDQPAAHQRTADEPVHEQPVAQEPATAQPSDASVAGPSIPADAQTDIPTPPSAADALRDELDELEQARTAPQAEQDASAGASLPDVLDEVLTASPAPAETVPLILKPLEWLNRPFASISTQTRIRLGKIGLITFINALAILAYVLFFRQNG